MNILGIDSKKITLWLTVIFLVSSLLGWSILEISNFREVNNLTGVLKFTSSADENNSEIYEKTPAEQVPQINKIVIQLSFEDIHIQESKDNAIHIQYQGNSRLISEAKKFFSITRTNQKLLLASNWKGLSLRSSSKALLILSLPTENLNLQELEAFTSSGDIKISNTQTDSLETKTSSGNIEIQDSFSQSLLATTTSGDIDVTNQLSRKNIEIATVSGNVDVKILKPGEVIEISSTSGDMELYLPPDSQLELHTKTMSGTIDSDFPISSFKSSGNRINAATSDTDYSLEVTIKTVSGDIEIMKSN